MRPRLHFAHANSFPGTTYRKMIDVWSQTCDTAFIDTIGHDPRYPVTDCWPHLVDELLADIRARHDAPVIGVGHSLGGFLMFFAAIRNPELFRSIVILDSPLMGPRRAAGIWLAKRLGFIQRVTPGGNTLKRRDHWADTEMVHDYFARKPAFARFDPDCLRAYAEEGTMADGQGGRILKFRPQVEHDIYGTLPHNTARFRGQLKVPGVLVAAEASDVLMPADLAFARKAFGLVTVSHPGSHLFPLERPIETAHSVLALAGV